MRTTTTLNIMRITRAMLINFAVFCLFQQTFFCEKVNGNTMKRQKTSALKQFSLPRLFKRLTAY